MTSRVRLVILSDMLAATRRRHFVRGLLSLLLAVIASVRAGGVALACESISTSHESMAAASHAGMAEHAQPGSDGCEEPERVRECSLMAACAPAVSERHVDDESVSVAAVAELHWQTGTPSTVDRSPEPPPPRA